MYSFLVILELATERIIGICQKIAMQLPDDVHCARDELVALLYCVQDIPVPNSCSSRFLGTVFCSTSCTILALEVPMPSILFELSVF